VRGVTLDTGALIAADRNDRRFWVWWKWLTTQGVVATLPAPVIAQAWRGPTQARMAMVISACRVVPWTSEEAKRTGELCALAGASDVVDAYVVRGAADRREDILTSDPHDLERLAACAPGVGRVRTLGELNS
jgi:hypothetical protein